MSVLKIFYYLHFSFRALEFTMAFLDKIISTTKKGQIEEDLRPICLLSYEETLKPYHGW